MAKTGALVILLTAALATPAIAQPAQGKRGGLFPRKAGTPPTPGAAKTAEPEPAAASAAKAVTITVAEAVQAALAYNPDVLQLSLDAEIAEAEVERQRGLFQPVLTASASQRRFGTYIALANANITGVTTTNSTVLSSGLSGRTGFGGTYALNLFGQRLDATNSLSTLLPQFQTQVSGRYTQALLRDGGTTANRGLVDRAEIARETSELARDERRQLLALEVVASYWTLVVRREEVRIREANLSEAKNLRELVERKIRGGQAPKSDAVQADVTVAERQQAVRQALLTVVNAERDLLALTYLNRAGQFAWDNVLVPADRPGDLPANPQFDAELEIALRSRPEVRRVERSLALARLDQAIADNGRKLRLDVYAEAGVIGLAGTAVATGVPELLQGSLGKSLSNMARGEAPFFEFGVQLEIPLGNADRIGAATQAKLRVEQVLALDVRTDVALDVRAAMQALAIARARLEGALAAEVLATDNVEAQRKRYEGGATTIFDTFRVQDELARAKAEIVVSAAEQEVALSQLIAARGTLLEHYGIDKPAKQ